MSNKLVVTAVVIVVTAVACFATAMGFGDTDEHHKRHLAARQHNLTVGGQESAI